jgi:hypothetical protein
MPISKKVMKLDEFPDCVLYRVACDCSADEHDLTIWIEYDENWGLTINFYADIEWFYWYDGFWGWFVEKWQRIKVAMRLLFVGWIEREQEFILRDPAHIDAFVEALEEGKNHCQKAKEEYEKKGIYN